MKRTLFIVAVLIAFATGASAASLTVVSDKATYNVGETITLTVTGDDGLDPGAEDPHHAGRDPHPIRGQFRR